MMRKIRDRIIQGYDVEMAIEYGVVTAIVWDKVNFWGNRGTRKDRWVYKTYEEMFKETGLKVDAVRAAYKRLSEMELIEIKTMKVNNTPKLHFRLLEFPLSEIQFSKENGNSNFLINTETNTETRTGVLSQPEFSVSDLEVAAEQNSSAVVNKTTVIYKSESSGNEYTVDEIIDKIHKALGGTGTLRSNDSRKQKMRARLKNFTLDEIGFAAYNLSQNDFNMGKNDGGVKYATVDFLIRSDTKLEEWLTKIKNKKAAEEYLASRQVGGKSDDKW